jgi:hypothetical protein
MPENSIARGKDCSRLRRSVQTGCLRSQHLLQALDVCRLREEGISENLIVFD